MDFRKRFIAGYPEIFGDGGGDEFSPAAQLSKKWGWLTIYHQLSGGDPLKFDQVAQMSAGFAFTYLTFEKDRLEAENKTLQNTTGQTVAKGQIQFNDCNNLILENIKRTGPYEGPPADGGPRDYFTLDTCTRVLVHHCHFDGEKTYSNPGGQIVDGCIDTQFSNYVTVLDCIFEGAARGMLLGYADTGTSLLNRGLLKFTIASVYGKTEKKDSQG